jgi:hypothetical protein
MEKAEQVSTNGTNKSTHKHGKIEIYLYKYQMLNSSEKDFLEESYDIHGRKKKHMMNYWGKIAREKLSAKLNGEKGRRIVILVRWRGYRLVNTKHISR